MTSALASNEYARVRFGIGRPPGRMDPADFVLRDFSAAERNELDIDLQHAADAVDMLVEFGLEITQNRFHAV